MDKRLNSFKTLLMFERFDIYDPKEKYGMSICFEAADVVVIRTDDINIFHTIRPYSDERIDEAFALAQAFGFDCFLFRGLGRGYFEGSHVNGSTKEDGIHWAKKFVEQSRKKHEDPDYQADLQYMVLFRSEEGWHGLAFDADKCNEIQNYCRQLGCEFVMVK